MALRSVLVLAVERVAARHLRRVAVVAVEVGRRGHERAWVKHAARDRHARTVRTDAVDGEATQEGADPRVGAADHRADRLAERLDRTALLVLRARRTRNWEPQGRGQCLSASVPSSSNPRRCPCRPRAPSPRGRGRRSAPRRAGGTRRCRRCRSTRSLRTGRCRAGRGAGLQVCVRVIWSEHTVERVDLLAVVML